jgi:hypothetical protein
MKKIFVDGFYSEICKIINCKTVHPFMPNDCDIIAISFYNNHWHQHQLVIDQLLKKTNKLIVNLSEPTTGNPFMSFDEFIKNNCNPKIRFFGDAVLNFESSNFELNHVWTEIWDDGGWIVAEYLHHSENTKGVVIGYYVSKQPWGIEAGKEIGLSTSLLFPCKDCSEEGEEGFVNNECHSCGGEGDFFEFDISR